MQQKQFLNKSSCDTGHPQKQEKPQINNLIYHLKEFQKEKRENKT